MGHIPHSPLRRTINVHWNAAVYNWTFQFLQQTVGGFITPTDPANFSAGAPPTSYQYALVTVQTSTPTPPTMPEPPALDSGAWQGATPGFNSSGLPDDALIGDNPPGYNGPFIADVSGGAYTVTIDTQYANASPPFDVTAGNSASLDWGGLSVTRADTPGVTWTSHSFISNPTINGSSAASGTMVLSANTYIGVSPALP